jgi:hypothetical protein
VSDDAERARRQRDLALRDIVELERQVVDEEIPVAVAERLRQEYEVRAADAIRSLGTSSERKRPAGRRGPVIAYVIAAVVALVAVAVVLPGQLGERPAGGTVSGNEALAPPTRDLSTVTDEEMEQVVAANPDVVGMRLALVRRYVRGGGYVKAVSHLEILFRGQLNAQDRAGAVSLVDSLLERADLPAAERARLEAFRQAAPR